MFGFSRPQPRIVSGPEGYRAYAVGDVHGRLDLLDQLLERIEADAKSAGDRKTYLIFLGDLIDRGPDSRGVVERLRTYQNPKLRLVVLMGNHEEALLRLIAGETGLLDNYLVFGGAECLLSYGVDALELATQPEADALRKLARTIPANHKSFLESFADTFRFGDYLFVHAGLRPGVELAAQTQTDMRWIRQPFLDDDSDFGFTVVHGHSISRRVEERANRIGIDTGAYRSGVLTAIAVEDERRWYLDTVPAAASV